MTIGVTRLGAGPDLVLLHGWGMNRHVWEPILPGLAAHFRLHLLDLPGHGDSSWAGTQPYSLDALVAALLAEAPPQACWLGWSLGGLVATQLAWRHPERVSRLIQVASSPCFVAREGWPGIQPEVLAGFHRQLGLDSARTLERFLAIQAMGSETVKEDARRLKSLLAAAPLPQAAALAGGLALLQQTDQRGIWSELTLPCVRLYGRLDSLVPRAAIPHITALRPESACHLFDKASHAPFLSHPEAFVAQIIQNLG